MKTYYTTHRLYRKDQQYWTFTLRWEAERLSQLEALIQALEVGLVIAGATQLSLEGIEFDHSTKTRSEITSSEFIETIQKFLRARKSTLTETSDGE